MPKKYEFHDRMLERAFELLPQPIPWDPVPWWMKLDDDRIRQFNEIQTRLNIKMGEIQAQKMKELAKVLKVPMR